jgi:hypothetical protein
VHLSLVCQTGDPPERVRAVLGPLRGVADEIVLGVDNRALDGYQPAYAALADQVVPVEFHWLAFDATLEDLHRRCRADWILRIDGDEVASRALLAALPQLTRDAEAAQWALPRRWLDADGRGWLDELPWWPDWQPRLVRRSADLRFEGGVHARPVEMAPILLCDAPIYHLDAPLKDIAARHAKALAYDALQPGMRGPGGRPLHAYYEPETWADLAPVPVDDDADRAAIDAVLQAAGRPALAAREPGAGVPARVRGAARGVELSLLERDLRFTVGERRVVALHAANTSAVATWGPHGAPPFRLGARWWGPDGTVVEGPRCGFPRAVGPGDGLTTLVELAAPLTPGRWTVVLDLLHDVDGWQGAACRLEADVRAEVADRSGSALSTDGVTRDPDQ